MNWRWLGRAAAVMPVLAGIAAGQVHHGPDNPHAPDGDFTYPHEPEIIVTSSATGTSTDAAM